MKNLDLIGFDADDTLWHNERFFKNATAEFLALLADYAEQDHLAERLLEAEKRNLNRYGFGIKGFTLSMIETALEVTDRAAQAQSFSKLLKQERICLVIRLICCRMRMRQCKALLQHIELF